MGYRVNIRKGQGGFTIAELVVAAAVLGVMSLALTSTFSGLTGAMKASYNERQRLNNQKIRDGLLKYARYHSTLGALPTPYTLASSSIKNAVYNPSSSTTAGLNLASVLMESGVSTTEINDDNYGSKRLRVYQMVPDLTVTVPLYFQSGPITTLTYQYGVIYQTDCSKTDTSCNNGTLMPGSSATMTSSNYATWTTSGNDVAAVAISSLPIQKQMLATTQVKLDKLRDAFIAYMRMKQQTALATDTTNWYPSGSSSLSGQTPGTNQGCRDGWYNLSSDTVILPELGLQSGEYGSTAWSGRVEYCRDYDPAGTSGANTPPHNGALRINKNVSTGSNPDTTTASNNIFLSF
jgi:type II secretory pathway pseudopilin PulG